MAMIMIIKDNGGRRVQEERRKSGMPIDFNERRTIGDRRENPDRRSGKDRRSSSGFRALAGYDRRKAWAMAFSIKL
ncbi:MAG: hypothetical protein AB1427_04100 [Thermodesulfobacteriota bacterium]